MVAQFAIAFSLLASGGLAFRAFSRLSAVAPGFATAGRVAGYVSLPPIRYGDDAAIDAFLRDVLAIAEREPGVLSVAVGSDLPFASGGGLSSFVVEGRSVTPGSLPPFNMNQVSPGYTATLGIPLLHGRALTDADRRGARRVMLVSQPAEATIFPGEVPVGRRITFDDDRPAAEQRWNEIVGVVGDVRRHGLARPPVPEAYLPAEQVGGAGRARGFTVIVRSDRADLVRLLPELVSRVDPELTMTSISPLSALVARSLSGRLSTARLLTVFAFVTLILATLGVFGLVSYATAQRTRELALRMALGATPGRVIRLVMEQALLLVALGLALGFALALGLGRALAAQLPGVASFDPLVFAAVPLLLLGTGVLACLAPAVRAVRIPPATALRYE